jgi:hypothetical protein
MTPTLVAGADYSGAKTVPNETWLALGTLSNDILEISQLSRCGSHKLAMELNAVKQLKAVGLDFPFSLPVPFIQFLADKLEQPTFENWQQLVEKLAFLPFEKFLELVTEFKVEPKRLADTSINRVAISPLHRGNPSMVQMTYQGMKLLASLDPKIFFVLPFQDAVPFGCAVMETYPREVLCSLNLPDTGYKTKDSEQSATMRKEIVRRLTRIRESKLPGREHCPFLTLSKGAERAAQESDHALDAVLACFSTAMWQMSPKLFKDPYETDDMNVFLEGWIYTPSLLKAQA